MPVVRAAFLAAALALPASAQQAPRHPDLDGVWAASFLTRLERPDGFADLVPPADQEAALIAKLTRTPKGAYDPDIDWFKPEGLLSVGGQKRSSWLVEPGDGRMPYTEGAKAAMERAFALEDSYDNPEERPGSERCVAGYGHAPITAVSLVIPSQIITAPGAILVMTEDTDMGRIIHLDGPEPPDAVRTRAGWSRGSWEGDTLVVETTHLAASDPAGILFRDGVVVGKGSKVIERFRLLGPDELLYQFTVEDSALYERPWRVELAMHRKQDRVYEYVCHEGNSSMASALLAGRLGKQTKPAK